ncbi:hypothetical protein ACLK1S_15735 [Escherichia coli]
MDFSIAVTLEKTVGIDPNVTRICAPPAGSAGIYAAQNAPASGKPWYQLAFILH